MLVIYTSKVTNRIKYTLDFVFNQYFGIAYELTENPVFSKEPGKFYINYSKESIPSFFSVFQHDLLLENNICLQEIIVSRVAEMPVFFQAPDSFDFKFDIFSCIFYLLSRYEEYLPHEKDMHGRYLSSNSILSKEAFNFSPVVEIWLHFFKDELSKQHPTFSFKKISFEYTPTFDIDNAYRYLGRNWLKNPANIFNGDCLKVLTKLQTDPYDIFAAILHEINTYQLNPVFFFLLSDTENHDSKVSPDSKRLHHLINTFNSYEIGIHPSYLSLENNLIEAEKEKLQMISGRTITNARQHFLRINFPYYYRKLYAAGIQKDFSLCYPGVSGFRAGCSRSFYFFDIEMDTQTELLLQPTCWMDATYEYYQPKKKIEIHDNFLTIINQLKKNNGKLVVLFHNDLLVCERYWGLFGFIHQQLKLGV